MADTDSSPSDRLSVSTGGGVLDVKICRIVQNIIFLCFVCCLLPEHLHGYGTQWRRRKERSWPTRSLSEDHTWKKLPREKRLLFICWEKIYFDAWIDLLFIFASTFATTSPRNQSIKFRDLPHYGWCNWSSFQIWNNEAWKVIKGLRSWKHNLRNEWNSRSLATTIVGQILEIGRFNFIFKVNPKNVEMLTCLINVFSRSFFLHSSVRSAIKESAQATTIMSIFINMEESETVIVLKYFYLKQFTPNKMGAEVLILPNS